MKYDFGSKISHPALTLHRTGLYATLFKSCVSINDKKSDFLCSFAMPPKKSVTVARANLAKARAKKAAKSSAAATSVKGVILGNRVAPSAQESHPGGSGLSGRKRAADDSPKRNMVNNNKKTKVAAAGAKLQDDSDSVEDENSCSLLSDEDFEKVNIILLPSQNAS